MSLFSKKAKEGRQFTAEEIEITRLNETLRRVVFFPGSQAEYEAFVGYQVRVIDNGLRNKGVRFALDWVNQDYYFDCDLETKTRLVQGKIEAIINCQQLAYGPSIREHHYEIFGLPVAKKD